MFNATAYEECEGLIIRKIAVYFAKIIIDMFNMKTVTIANDDNDNDDRNNRDSSM